MSDPQVRAARRRLDARRSAASEGAEPTGGEPQDPRVRALARRGRLERIEVDPHLMRAPARELAERLTAAANAALAAERATMPEPGQPPVDFAVLTDQLREVEVQVLRTMDTITRGIEAAVARVGHRTGMAGDPGAHDLAQLLEQTMRGLAVLQSPGRDPQTPDLRGEGSDIDGRVRAVATPDGRIQSVTLPLQTRRLASQDLASHAVTAINAALDDVHARVPRAGSPRPDPAEVTARVRAVQDLSVAQMRA